MYIFDNSDILLQVQSYSKLFFGTPTLIFLYDVINLIDAIDYFFQCPTRISKHTNS